MFGGQKMVRQAPMSLYTVYDRVAEEAGPCFLAVNDGVAMRNFRALLAQSQVVAEDEYQLYKLGSYDSKTMQIQAHAPLKILVPHVVEDMTEMRLPGTEVTNVQ